MSTNVAVVTGANKGIGFAIVRGLCKRFDGDVYLTSRDVERGKKAVEELVKEGLNPKYHQLDVTVKESLESFRDYIKKNYGRIDVLVNNVGIAFRIKASEPASVQAEQTLLVNYFSMVTTCDTLFPLLIPGARVVNLTSSLGHLGKIPSENLRRKFLDPNLTVPELSGLMQKYIEATKEGTQVAEWGNSSYRVSKVGVTALTMIQQRMLKERGVIVNAVHPGYCSTDLTSFKGHLSIDEGAVSPIYAAMDVTESLTGMYLWCNKEPVLWSGPTPGP